MNDHRSYIPNLSSFEKLFIFFFFNNILSERDGTFHLQRDAILLDKRFQMGVMINGSTEFSDASFATGIEEYLWRYPQNFG